MTQAFTITEEDIIRIRSEARAAGSAITVAMCNVALGEADEDDMARVRYLEPDDAWALLDLGEIVYQQQQQWHEATHTCDDDCRSYGCSACDECGGMGYTIGFEGPRKVRHPCETCSDG